MMENSNPLFKKAPCFSMPNAETAPLLGMGVGFSLSVKKPTDNLLSQCIPGAKCHGPLYYIPTLPLLVLAPLSKTERLRMQAFQADANRVFRG